MSRIMGAIHDEIAKRGHQIDYFCNEDFPSAGYVRALRRFSFPLAVRRHVIRMAKEGQPYDIVNVHEPSAAALVVSQKDLRPAQIVVTSHGVEERGWAIRLEPQAGDDERPGLKSQFIYPATVLRQARLGLRRADHIFCLNSDDRQFIQTKYGRQPGDITHIFPGADPTYARLAADRSYQYAKTVIFAASWLPRKGTRELITAFTNLASRHPDMRLALLNVGKPAADVLSEFPENVRARVDCVKAAPEEGTATALANADIFVLPSVFEGTPLTLIEAMWSGLPVVTTATCGMKDVIQNERNGLLVSPRDPAGLETALDRLLRAPDLRK
jgi:glycosyltransferase involved in cell wall biosynthesis